MPKITVFGGFSSEHEVVECPGNSSSKSAELTEKTTETDNSLTAQKTVKSLRKPKASFTADSVEESTTK